MKSSFLKIGVALVLVMMSPMISHGASGDTTPESVSTGSTSVETPLKLEEITVQDDMHVLVSFDQNIVTEAVRVRITKQSDGSAIKVDKITSVVDTPKSVLIGLSDVLEEGATYTMTIMSAISEDGVVIKEGADAMKEFTAAAPLKKALVTFNAPTNQNAVVANTGAGTPTVAATGTTTSVSETATELPLTGMNPLLFLILAGGLAIFFLPRKKA